MIEIMGIALLTLGIVLYGQARHAAREIRRNRTSNRGNWVADLVLSPTDRG